MRNRYESALCKLSLECDEYFDQGGELVRLVNDIVEGQSISSTQKLYLRVCALIQANSDGNDEKKKLNALVNSLIDVWGYYRVKEICRECDAQEDGKSLNELIDELNSLVGLNMVKETVNDLVSYQQIQQKREKMGLLVSKGTMHMAFLGNPGTGKTTVARIVGRIYKQLGLLSKGHFVEVSRTDLIAGYQGQTALKVKKVIDRARGGVLFIDEAYSITENEHSDSYGRECLTELTKALEDYRDDLVVIVAGYTDLMEQFFESNPGLKSRFNTFIHFEDYNGEELKTILFSFVEKNQYIMTDEAIKKIQVLIGRTLEHKDNNFSNGRYVRNLYDDLVLRHAKRVVGISNPSRDDLMTITEEDVVLD